MRGHLEILNEIDKLLVDNGLESERQQLETQIRTSFTSGELCLRAGSKLLTLQNTNKQISSLAGHLINEFISYCHSNGLYPKANYET
jgi:hypothetical protein